MNNKIEEFEVCVLENDYKKIKVSHDILLTLSKENIIFTEIKFECEFKIIHVIREEDLHLIEKLKIKQKIKGF